ncbi:MAG: Gfo/Idh/MocA family protein [Candidatus Xenobia bacterium]
MISVALVGYGLAGAVFHAPLIKATPGMQVRCIVTGSRQEAARRDFPEARLVSRLEDVEGCDLAVIATPNQTHVPLGMVAMEGGMDVVVDKPMAVSVAEGERLLAAARRLGRRLTVFQNRRWDNDFLTVQKVLPELGALVAFESRYERFRPTIKAGWREEDVQAGGSVLFDLGSHIIDQALVLFGMPSRVSGEVQVRRPGGQVADDAFLALHYPSGVRVHLWASLVAAVPGPRFRVLGLERGFEKFGTDPQEEQLRAGQGPGSPGWGMEPRQAWGRLQGEPRESELGCYESFYSILRDGGTPVPPEEALNVLRVIEMVTSR